MHHVEPSRGGTPVGMTVALVGVGRMGRFHLRALEQTDRFDRLVVVDPSSEARREAQAHGLETFAAVDQLLGATPVDAAIVAAPTGHHLDVLRALIGQGLPVLCEKPCGRSPDEARTARELAERAGVVLQVGYWRRFVPALVALRERIARGTFGRVSLVSCFQWDERPPSAAFRATSGGIVVDMGVHEFDELRWLTGQRIVAASGFASSVRFDPPVEGDPESVAIAVALSEGALGMVSLGRRFAPGELCRVEVIGTDDAADIPFVAPPDGDSTFLSALVTQVDAFAVAVEGGPMTGASADDAIEALEAARIVRRAMTGA